MVAAVRDLADLRAEIRQRCDQVSSTFVSDAELDSWIQQSAAALLDLVLDYAGPDAFLETFTGTTTPASDTLTLAAAVYRVLGVDVSFDGVRYQELDRATFRERNRFASSGGWTSPADTAYMLGGRDATTGVPRLRWLPTPAATLGVRVWYLPNATTLVASSKPLVSINGWDEWLVADVAAKVLEKEESDSRPFLLRKAEATKRIIAAAKALDSGEPLRMRDAADDGVPWPGEDDEPLWSG